MWRVGFTILAIEVVATVLLLLVLTRSINARALNAAHSRMATVCAAIAPRYGELVRDGDQSRLLETVLEDATRLNLRISVVSEDGAIAIDSHAHGVVGADALLGNPSIAGAMVNSVGQAVLRDTALGGPSVMAARQIAPRPNRAALRVGMHAPEQAEARAAAAGVALPFGGAVLALTLAILALASARLRGDARALTEDAGAIEAGDAAHRLGMPRTPELRGLALAVNAMAARLGADLERHRMRSRERRAVIRSMPGAVLAMDVDQRILSVNKVGEQMLGIREKRARGRLLQEVLRQPDLNAFVQEAFDAEGRYEDEFEIDSEKSIIVQAASRPLRSPRDEIVGRVVVLQDVTRLRRLERVRRDFAANVSHELRTPITNIKGYIETLQDTPDLASEDARRFIEVIARNAERLWLIVEDMLELARLEDPEAVGSLAMAPTSVDSVVGAAVEDARDMAVARGVAIKTDCPSDLRVRAGRRLLEQAIFNLLSNAVRHSPERGEVRVEARRVEDDEGDSLVEIAVIDHGPGVQKQHLPRLFERFYRVDPARSRSDGGTGLGLAIVKHVARLHNGREGVESVVGKGSRFWIRLPECPADAPENGAA
jgi:two-component system phosphate regulon sensor histidine kinase PhoR